MIRTTLNVAGAVGSGVANVVGGVAGAALGGVAGAVQGAFNGAASGASRGSRIAGRTELHGPQAPTTQNLLNAMQSQQNMIGAMGTRPRLNNNSLMPRTAQLPGGMSDLTAAALNEGNRGVAEAGGAMNGLMQQMKDIQVMNMRVQNDVAMAKMVASAFEGIAKEVKKSGDSLKNMAG